MSEKTTKSKKSEQGSFEVVKRKKKEKTEDEVEERKEKRKSLRKSLLHTQLIATVKEKKEKEKEKEIQPDKEKEKEKEKDEARRKELEKRKEDEEQKRRIEERMKELLSTGEKRNRNSPRSDIRIGDRKCDTSPSSLSYIKDEFDKKPRLKDSGSKKLKDSTSKSEKKEKRQKELAKSESYDETSRKKDKKKHTSIDKNETEEKREIIFNEVVEEKINSKEEKKVENESKDNKDSEKSEQKENIEENKKAIVKEENEKDIKESQQKTDEKIEVQEEGTLKNIVKEDDNKTETNEEVKETKGTKETIEKKLQSESESEGGDEDDDDDDDDVVDFDESDEGEDEDDDDDEEIDVKKLESITPRGAKKTDESDKKDEKVIETNDEKIIATPTAGGDEKENIVEDVKKEIIVENKVEVIVEHNEVPVEKIEKVPEIVVEKIVEKVVEVENKRKSSVQQLQAINNEQIDQLTTDLRNKTKQISKLEQDNSELKGLLEITQKSDEETREKYEISQKEIEIINKKRKKLETKNTQLNEEITKQNGIVERQSKYIEFLLSLLSSTKEFKSVTDKYRELIESESPLSSLEEFQKSQEVDTKSEVEEIEEEEDELLFSKGASDSVSYNDRWTSKTSGGCFNNPTWWKNPQYLLYVDESCEVTIRLSQSKAEHIGYYILSPNVYHKRSILKEELMDKCSFEDLPEISKNFMFQASKNPYIIIPCTYDTGIHGSFTITAETKAKPIIFKKLVKSIDWVTTSIEDKWIEKYAGGCKNHPNTWMENHQYLITSQTKTYVRLLLQYGAKENVDDLGIYVVSSDDETTTKLQDPFKAVVVHKSGFNRQNEAQVDFYLNPDEKLVIIPCTFEPHKQASYQLTIFSEKTINVVKLSEPKTVSVTSEWAGSSMGGCLNHPSWRNNPQYALTISDNVQIKLSQLNSLANPHAIGFYIIRSEGGRVLEVTKENFVAKANFTANQSIISTIQAQSLSTFTIIPCTFKPNRESKFKLEVFCDNQSSTLELTDARSDWIESMAEGEWKGRSAGGCLNHHTWRNNDQIRLAAEKSGQVVLVLEQNPNAYNYPLSIGLYITKKPVGGDKIFTDKPGDILKKVPFKKTASLTCKFEVEAGVEYNIIPAAFTPFDESSFKLFAYGYRQSLIFHTIVEDPDIVNNRTWEGSWDVDSSGGCMKHVSWPKNPKFYLLSNPANPTPVEIVLTQETKSDEKIHPIGLAVCHCDDEGNPVIGSVEDVIINSNYEDSREVAVSIVLPPSSSPFVIIPSTFEPNQLGKFCIQVFSNVSNPVLFSHSLSALFQAINDHQEEEVPLASNDKITVVETPVVNNNNNNNVPVIDNNNNNQVVNIKEETEKPVIDNQPQIETKIEINNNEINVNPTPIQETTVEQVIENKNNNLNSGKAPPPPPPPMPIVINAPKPPPPPSLGQASLKSTPSSSSSTPAPSRISLLSDLKKVSLKDHSERKVPEKAAPMSWTPFNIDMIVARRAVLEHLDDDDEGDTEEWYDDGDWD